VVDLFKKLRSFTQPLVHFGKKEAFVKMIRWASFLWILHSAHISGANPITDFRGLLESDMPSMVPSDTPSSIPSDAPSSIPSDTPSSIPSDVPSVVPSDAPSMVPSDAPSVVPSDAPSVVPSDAPSTIPSVPLIEEGDGDTPPNGSKSKSRRGRLLRRE